VLSRGRSDGVPGAEFARSFEEVIQLCGGDAWVIGGATVYQLFLPLATRAEITEVDGSFVGDAYAPTLDESWRLESDSDPRWRVSATGLSFRFRTYLREPGLIDLGLLEGSDAGTALGVTKFGHLGV
jgi:dihydrofolate reductase